MTTSSSTSFSITVAPPYIMQAIENGNVKKFTSAIDSMHTAVQSAEDTRSMLALRSRYLDICIRQVVVSRHKRVRCYYYMSLMAYAAIHSQKAIVDILIDMKASMYLNMHT